MTLPERIDADWIGTLTNEELQGAESLLHGNYTREEMAERKRRGNRYDLMRGPEPLMTAWLRWSLVSNAVRARGLRVRSRRS
jgi:hypothetical protein